MSELKNGAWVLIADGEKALFLQNMTDGENPHLDVFREEEQENPPNREQAANRRGRFNDGPNVHRSAVEDTDWHQLQKERFAQELADILYKKAHQGSFDHIVLVAPPKTLGELRDELHQEVANKVIGEIPKTLTNHPVDEIEKIVKEELNA
jgi:protein required for attachment to host cells